MPSHTQDTASTEIRGKDAQWGTSTGIGNGSTVGQSQSKSELGIIHDRPPYLRRHRLWSQPRVVRTQWRRRQTRSVDVPVSGGAHGVRFWVQTDSLHVATEP